MLTSSYLDVPTFQRGAPGVETASLVGGNASLAASVSAGATSITVTSGTGFAASSAWIFDGPATELVTIASVSGATLTLAAGPLWVEISYTGGLVASALPGDVVQAVAWVACHLLGVRENPTGASERVLGKKKLTNRLRGDREESNLWLANARVALEPYRNRQM